MRFIRKTIFWLHLVCGIIAGVVIAIMCFTGVMLAFDTEILAWVDRHTIRITPPAPDAQPLEIDDLLRRAAEDHPDFPFTSVTVSSDPHTAHTLATVGRGAVVRYQDKYTGEVRPRAARHTLTFMNAMIRWHRWLDRDGSAAPIGKALTGACNLAFVGLTLSGLYLWFPRKWNWRALRPSTIIIARLRGKARDWNWHNALGLWSTSVLLVLTLTALPFSYRWASDLVTRAFGETPATQTTARTAPPGIDAPEGARPLTTAQLLAGVQQRYPDWRQITFRKTAPDSGAEKKRPAVTFTLRDPERLPQYASTQLALNPYTGDILRADDYSTAAPSRRFRAWTRYLHTGEALGWPGQLTAGLACVIGLVLVYTGFALSWRRFTNRRAG